MMISKYVENKDEKERNSIIDFTFDTSLIAISLAEILSAFKNIVKKAQDTIGSHTSFSEQQIANLNQSVQTLEKENAELKEKNNLLQAANNGFNIEKEALLKSTEEQKAIIADKEKEIALLSNKNLENLEEIRALHKVQENNVVLDLNYHKAQSEISRLRSLLDNKNLEIEKLLKKAERIQEELADIKLKTKEEIKEMESSIQRECEIDKKLLY